MRMPIAFVVLYCTVFFAFGMTLGDMVGRSWQRARVNKAWEEKLIEGQHGFYHPETGEFELRELQIIRQMPRGLDA